MGNRMRFPLGGATILATMLVLTGCLPLPISLAINGLSYVASGKSVSDHFISSYVKEDCSIGRALIEQNDICQDQDGLTIIVEDIGDDQSLDISEASGEDSGI